MEQFIIMNELFDVFDVCDLIVFATFTLIGLSEVLAIREQASAALQRYDLEGPCSQLLIVFFDVHALD